MTFWKYITLSCILTCSILYQSGCNYLTHRTISKGAVLDSTSEDPEPDYDVSLDNDYQDFSAYLFPGNRVENFSAYFNKHFKAEQDFEDALKEYRASLINEYSKRLDSLGVTPPVSGSVKDKLNKSIERASKIIQFHKNSKYIDDAVLIIGMSYYYLADYLNSERKFNEFLSKLSSSENADEAILFLGRSKFKLGKRDEGEKILKNLLNNTKDNEIKSLAVRDLGVLAYNKGNFDEAINDFKLSISYSKDDDRKAEGQFILAKIISSYKPELAAAEYKKVLDYSSDFDLNFFAKLNYAKGLIYNKDFLNADEILTDLRKKYREVPAYTQLVDLEIANNLYGQNKMAEANNKYYEVIIKYAGFSAASDAYYYLGLHEEKVNKDFLNALINYKKAVAENASGEFYKESVLKVSSLDKYFILQGETKDSTELVTIPSENKDVEKYRRKYNEEKGIEQAPTNPSENNGNPKGNVPIEQEPQTGTGKGKPGGIRGIIFKTSDDSLKENESNNPEQSPVKINENSPVKSNRENNLTGKERNIDIDSTQISERDSSKVINTDSIKAATEAFLKKSKREKTFNAYYSIAEIFIYEVKNSDSAEHYLKLILKKFDESDYQVKTLYTLGNFYKNNNNKDKADEVFNKIISDYPNTVYAYESKSIMGISANQSDITQNPVDEIFSKAFNMYNDKNYNGAIAELYTVEEKFPNDTSLAKSYYGLGYIYENSFFNKDSAVFYYKKLKQKFPNSLYTLKISDKLDYIASLEIKDTVKTLNPEVNNDSTAANVTDSTVLKPENIQEEKKEEVKTDNTEEVIPDTTNVNSENKLSQEEIDKLLKETEIPPK